MEQLGSATSEDVVTGMAGFSGAIPNQHDDGDLPTNIDQLGSTTNEDVATSMAGFFGAMPNQHDGDAHIYIEQREYPTKGRVANDLAGILEVLLVWAKGIKHTNVTGRPAYYVIIECGTQVQRTQASIELIGAGNHKEICRNEKFTFEFPSSEWENLTHLKCKIMDEEYFTDGGFVGQTIRKFMQTKEYLWKRDRN